MTVAQQVLRFRVVAWCTRSIRICLEVGQPSTFLPPRLSVRCLIPLCHLAALRVVKSGLACFAVPVLGCLMRCPSVQAVTPGSAPSSPAVLEWKRSVRRLGQRPSRRSRRHWAFPRLAQTLLERAFLSMRIGVHVSKYSSTSVYCEAIFADDSLAM